MGGAYHHSYLSNCMSKCTIVFGCMRLKIYIEKEIWIFEVIFVVFRLMKNIIFNKTKSYVGRNTSDHVSQIFCSKSNCETTCMYNGFFLLEITVVKIKNNLNVCSAHSYLYPRSRFSALLVWQYCYFEQVGKWAVSMNIILDRNHPIT